MKATTSENTLVIHGFKLLRKEFIKEINAEASYFEHSKSGARLVKIAALDENKTFSISFRTFPLSDNGTPHIMEHSVLNGSKNFPVKSPFDVLQKGSLSTFMNAFTSKDFTTFPVASMNEKDYFNLMHIYLDAVFNPLIYVDDRILKQEGWHYELEDPEGPVTYKGVVFNEMKGAFSNPQRELWYQTYKNLFPDSPYGFESGGHPLSIPSLTQSDFLDYHRQFYDPENSYIFLYGDAELEQELEFIDREFLSQYTKTGNIPEIADQKPLGAGKKIKVYYPALDGVETKDQTFLSVAYVAGHNTNLALTMSLDILCEVMVNQESAPLRLALEKAGIGHDVSAFVTNYKQNVFQITVQNANASDSEKFEQIITEVFTRSIHEGINKQEIEAILNRLEFHLREGNDAQKGWTCISQMLPGWFFADDPFSGLMYEIPLAEIKSSLTTNYLETILKKYFLESRHSLIITLEPKPGLDKQNNLILEEKLERFKEELSEEEKAALVEQTRDLLEYQKREDTPDILDKIPLLDIDDITPHSLWYGTDQFDLSGIPVLYHEEFTNEVIYLNLYFDLRVIPYPELPYASLLSNLLGLLNTTRYTYGELNRKLNAHTGGFMTTVNAYQEFQDEEKFLPKFKVTSKAMKSDLGNLAELAGEIILNSRFNDTERIKCLLIRHLSQLEANIKRDGYTVATHRISSYFSWQGVFNEQTSGLDYYWFVQDLVKNIETKSDHIISMLKKVADAIFTRNNLIIGITCGRNDLETLLPELNEFAGRFANNGGFASDWLIEPRVKNEGILASSKVQYVIKGYNYKKLGYKWNGKMRVLNQVLSTDWLQNRVRVIGGAYGGWSSFGLNGSATFNSYRDPNLRETFRTYDLIPDYLSNFDIDQKGMTRYIIGTISTLDKPLTVSQRGEQAFSSFFIKRRNEDFQADRQAILSTTPEDIREFSGMVKEILDQKSYCVYGNAERLTSEYKLFTSLINI